VVSPQEETIVEIVGLSAGLSILRYISAQDSASPPTVRVSPRSSSHGLRFLPVPGEEEGVLRAPGAAIVLVAAAATELAVTTIRQPGSSSAAVDLHLEVVADPLSSEIGDHIPPGGISAPIRLSMLGHVARQGDVFVASGEWLGGPEFPARIEGLEICWPNLPLGLQLEYSVVIGGSTPLKLPDCSVNEFAGTRGRSAPILALTIALRGQIASRYQIRVDCLFLGGQMISESGQKLTLSGPTGREPLVGLRLWIEATPEF
jgi:hypothetical protein